MAQHQEAPQQTISHYASANDAQVAQAAHSLGSATLLSAGDDTQGYYVIVGRGTAAVVNHTTLRQTEWGKRRIGGLTILHIGFEDPWSHYLDHRMGQNSHLLSMPGYERRPSARERKVNRPRKSRRFAADTRHEFERLSREYSIKVMPGFVALIQPEEDALAMKDERHRVRDALEKRGINTAPFNIYPFQVKTPYRLLVVGQDRRSWLVYAYKIDICTGSGRPRALKGLSNYVYQSMNTGVIVRDGLSYSEWKGPEPWETPEDWSGELKQRRVISGAEALYREYDWGRDVRVCVMGEGGIGVNMVERGEQADAWLDWIAKERLSDQCFDNPRNHTILRHPNASSGQRMKSDEFQGSKDPNAVCDPACKRWRFGKDSVVSQIRKESDGTLKITYKTFYPRNNSISRNPQVRDFFEVDTSLHNGCFPYSSDITSDQDACPRLDTESYDLLIICSGQDPEETGQPYEIMQLFRNQLFALTIDHQVIDPSLLMARHHVVGMCLPDTSQSGQADETCHVPVRVLGAANFVVIGEWLKRKSQGVAEELKYKRTLPRQAQLDGFTFCAVAIAHANHYFDREKNRNVNTATVNEIRAQVGSRSLALEIMNLRAESASGFVTIDELKQALTNAGVTGWQAVGNLSDDYRPPDQFLH